MASRTARNPPRSQHATCVKLCPRPHLLHDVFNLRVQQCEQGIRIVVEASRRQAGPTRRANTPRLPTIYIFAASLTYLLKNPSSVVDRLAPFLAFAQRPKPLAVPPCCTYMTSAPCRMMESYATASKSGHARRPSSTCRHGGLSSAQSHEATRHSPLLPHVPPSPVSYRSRHMGHFSRSHACAASRPASSNLVLHAPPLKLHCGIKHAPRLSHDWIKEQCEGQGSGSGSNSTAARSMRAIPPPSLAALQFSTIRFASAPIASTAS
eukprot:470404-Rhodomonas_salina.2